MINVEASVDEREVFEQLSDQELREELSDRGYIILKEGQPHFKRSVVDFLNSINGGGLNYHASKEELVSKVEELI